MAERLYGYAFKEITGPVPVFHPDVRVYRVTNKADGSHVGFLYRDDFRAPVQALRRVAGDLPGAAESSTASRSTRSSPTTTTSPRARPASRC